MSSPHLERKLKEVLGDDAGAEQAAVNGRIDTIRGDIAELRHETRSEFGAIRGEIRLGFTEITASIETLRVEIRAMATKAEVADARAALKQDVLVQSRWMIGLWAAVMLAVIGLYGTVIALAR